MLRESGLASHEITAVQVALSEAVASAVLSGKHGPDDRVTVRFRRTPGVVQLAVHSPRIGWITHDPDRLTAGAPGQPGNPERPSWFGIRLIHELVDAVAVSHCDDGTQLTLTKKVS